MRRMDGCMDWQLELHYTFGHRYRRHGGIKMQRSSFHLTIIRSSRTSLMKRYWYTVPSVGSGTVSCLAGASTVARMPWQARVSSLRELFSSSLTTASNLFRPISSQLEPTDHTRQNTKMPCVKEKKIRTAFIAFVGQIVSWMKALMLHTGCLSKIS